MSTGEKGRVGDAEKLEVAAAQYPLPREWYHPHGMGLSTSINKTISHNLCAGLHVLFSSSLRLFQGDSSCVTFTVKIN